MTESLHLHTYNATYFSNGGPLQQEAEAFFTFKDETITYLISTVGGGELMTGTLDKEQATDVYKWLMAWAGRTVTDNAHLPLSVQASFVVESGEYLADFTQGMEELREWLEEVLRTWD